MTITANIVQIKINLIFELDLLDTNWWDNVKVENQLHGDR